MLPISIGVTSQSTQAAALSATISINGPPEVALPQQGLPSNPGEISTTVSPSGGSGSYTYAWSLILVDNGGGVVSINSQGRPTNQVAYDSATVVGGSATGLNGIVVTQCVVDDGASSVTVTSNHYTILVLY